MLDNKHLRSFLRVLDMGSFSKAARSLRIAQPALSQHVRKLEETLGTRLLDRSAHGVRATASGRDFAPRAREIVGLVEAAGHRYRGASDMLRGEVRLGLPGSVCPALAPPLIEAAARRMPHVRLLISEMMSGDLAARLAEGRTDLAILFDVEETEDYGSTHLLTERLHLIGAPGSPHMASETVDAVHLASLDLIGTRLPHGLRLLLERWSTETGIPLRFRFEVDAPTVLVRLAASGFGHAIVSKAAIAHELPAGHLCAAEIASPPIDRKVCLASSKRVPPDASRDAIHRLMREVTSEILAQDAWPGGTGLATFSASSSE